MNFKEWFDSQTKIGYPCFMDYLSVQKGWDAAKQEILKIINDKKGETGSEEYRDGYEAALFSVEDNIKDL